MSRVADRVTPVSLSEYLEALHLAWKLFFQEPPQKDAFLVVASQGACEAGNLAYVHRYNFGKLRSVDGDGRDYTYYAVSEEMPLPVAAAYEAAATDGNVRIIERREEAKRAVVWFYPEHPACRFRAYKNAQQGALDQLADLADRFQDSWVDVLRGDHAAFARSSTCGAKKLTELHRTFSDLFPQMKERVFRADLFAQAAVLREEKKALLLRLGQRKA